MGAGAGVCAEGGWGHVGQIATCNLNLRATRTTRKTETEDKIKVRGRKKKTDGRWSRRGGDK